jgi:hypothetical protein
LFLYFQKLQDKLVVLLCKKNNIFEMIKPDLKTNENFIATYKGEPIEVAGKGVVT